MKFDPDRHEYSEDDGTLIPGVTTILKAAGVIDDRWYNAEARDRGSAVHALCERYANGERSDKHGRYMAGLEYVRGFAEWLAVYGVYAEAAECRVYGKINGKAYAGTFDLLAIINGKRVLVDIKTGAKAKWHPVQLAAYAMARPVVDGVIQDRQVNPDALAVLYLQPETYRYEKIPGLKMVEAIQEFKGYLHGN